MYLFIIITCYIYWIILILSCPQNLTCVHYKSQYDYDVMLFLLIL